MRRIKTMLGKRRFWLYSLTVGLALCTVLLGKWTITEVKAEAETYEGLKIFTEVLSVVERNYVEEVKTKDLIYDAIRGMLRSLDPHSGFLTPESYQEMQVETKGEFGGLGIQIGIKDGALTVIAPIEDTPAFKAGILAGDIILKINNEQTKDMSLHDAVNKMRGAKGTSVTISVIRKGWKEAKDFAIVRDIIRIKSVKHRVIEDNIGYIKVNQFQERTADDLAAALKELAGGGSNVVAIILDLRNNPGGLLNSAVDVAGQFLPPGKLVVYIKGRTGERNEYRTSQNGPSYGMPMVVLVNQGSASASEIVAGALKDWKRAVVIGIKTFGKGSVQSVIPLSEGAGLRLTTAKYYTPKGISIQNTGIEPDIKVELEAKNGLKEHPVLREKDLERHLENEQKKTPEEEPQSAPSEETVIMGPVEEKDDTQLQRAIDLLKTWNIFKEMSVREDVPANP